MLIRVKAHPESKRDEVIKIKEGKFEVYVRASPKNNEANTRIIELLRKYFPEARGIKMISGGTRKNKTFEIVEPKNTLL